MSKPEIGAGDVKIDLVGHGEVTLRPSLDACRRLAGMQGGIVKLAERVRNWEFDAIYTVIAIGIGSSSKDLPDLIYKTGMISLVGPCCDFLTIISNGGRRFVEEKTEEESDPLERGSL